MAAIQKTSEINIEGACRPYVLIHINTSQLLWWDECFSARYFCIVHLVVGYIIPRIFGRIYNFGDPRLMLLR